MVQWQNARLPRGRSGFDSRSMHFDFENFFFQISIFWLNFLILTLTVSLEIV